VAGADASPHLAMACVLAGLHYGIINQPAPDDSRHLPRDFFTALDAFNSSRELGSYFPDQFQDLYAALRRAETADLLATVSAQEFAWYL
jgi:glutamine synthetase